MGTHAVAGTALSGSSLPTVSDVLALPGVARGMPTVCAGRDGLDRRVRWVHISELPDIAELLRGGEMILCTGVALPETAEELREYARTLAEGNTAALVIELGRRYAELPRALVTACQRHGLPLIALHRVVPFVKVTESVHALIIEEQLATLRSSEEAHEVFTSLALAGAPPEEIVGAASRMSGCPVVFEDLSHRALAFEAAGTAVDDLLRNWEGRSRAARPDSRTETCGPEGWLVTTVEARGDVWGRLVMLPLGEPLPYQVMLLERAATALTLHQLIEHNRQTVERQAHRSTLSDIIARRYASPAEMHARTAALGVPTASMSLVAITIRLPSTDDREQAAELIGTAMRFCGTTGLVAGLPDGGVGVLLALHAPAQRSSVLDALAARVHEHARRGDLGPAVLGVATTVHDLDDVARAFTEAEHVADAARGATVAKPFYELPDVQLRGLLYVLRADSRLRTFVERTLSALLDHDHRHGTDLVAVLRAFLRHADNKSAAATEAHLSRPALYERLASIERVLGVDLTSAETRTSLHAALMAWESAQNQES